MKKMIEKTFLSLSLIAIFSSSAIADGNTLLNQCLDAMHYLDTKEVRSEFNIGMCIGLVQGVRDGMKGTSGALPENLRLCWPKETITNDQSIRIVVKYLKDNPAELHRYESMLILESFVDAYHCK